MKRISLFFLLLLMSLLLCAQNIQRATFQNPDVASLAAEILTPVSLSSGSVGVEIPLYTIVQGDVVVPISMSYDATGIKVSSHPGWTGQNWTLKAGGMITRIVKSIPDETRVGWDIILPNYSGDNVQTSEYFWGYNYNMNKLNVSDWNTVNRLTEWAKPYSSFSELESDEYVFNFCGHAGKFYLDNNGGIKVVGQEGYIIEPITLYNMPLYDGRIPIWEKVSGSKYNVNDDAYTYQDGSDNEFVKLRECRILGFKVTDPEGFVYYFGMYEKADRGEINVYEDVFEGVEINSSFFAQLYDEIYSTWYLVKIVSPLQNQVEFHYELGYPVATFYNSYSMSNMRVNDKASFWNLWSPGYMQVSSEGQNLDGSLISPMYLKSITTSNLSVEFSRSKSNGRDYDYDFIQDFLHQTARESYNPNVQSAYFYGIWPIADAHFILNNNRELVESKVIRPGYLQWEKLDEISIKWKQGNRSPVKYRLSYRENPAERLQLTSIQKVAGAESEPPYLFGYNNSKKLPGYLDFLTDHWGYYNGVYAPVSDKVAYINYREPNSNYTDGEILQKITYPTGGVKEFVYELNTYTKVVKRNSVTGDISVVSIPERCGGGLRIKAIIEKTDLNSVARKKSYTYLGGILNGEIQYYWPDYKGKLTNGNNYTATRFFSSSILPVSDNSAGGSVSYTSVTENILGAGRTEYTFNNHDTNPDENAISIDPQKSVYSPLSSRVDEREKLLKEEVFEGEGQKIVKRTTYTYYPPNLEKYIRSVQVRNFTLFDGTSPNAIEGAAYKVYTYPILLQAKTEENFSEQLTPSLCVKTDYQYNDMHQIAQEVRSESNASASMNVERKIVNKYVTNYQPMDNLGQNIKYNLIQKHILTPLMKQTEFLNGQQIKETLYEYSMNYPHVWRIQESSNSLPLRIIYEGRWEDDEKPIYVILNGNMSVVYIWSYNRQHLIAEIKNATYDDVCYILHPDSYTDQLIPNMDPINSLRDKLKYAQVTTYTYLPSGEIESVTDPNGVITTYEYDALGRLKIVRDAKGCVVKSYEYHYKN